MAKKNFSSLSEEKNALGKLISELRSKKKLSLRKLADVVGLSPSNMTYIEKGINAPTAEVYEKILKELNPKAEEKNKMDRLYCKVRKIPTPEVCQVILNNYELGEKIKKIGDTILTTEQLKLAEELFESFGDT
jgi:transcriptional regulator with XRE-family HTH domain